MKRKHTDVSVICFKTPYIAMQRVNILNAVGKYAEKFSGGG